MGYGTPKSGQTWFLGTEENGGTCRKELNARLKLDNFTDILSAHESYATACSTNKKDCNCKSDNQLKWFSRKVLQPTWSKVIRLYLCAQNRCGAENFDQHSKVNPEKFKNIIRNFQASEFGKSDKNNLVVELLPLPITKNWMYRDYASEYPELQSLQRYRKWKELVESRISKFQTLYKEFPPKLIIAYTLGHLEDFKAIVNNERFTKREFVEKTAYKSQTMVIIYSPNTRGITNQYFERVGHWIRDSWKDGT